MFMREMPWLTSPAAIMLANTGWHRLRFTCSQHPSLDVVGHHLTDALKVVLESQGSAGTDRAHLIFANRGLLLSVFFHPVSQ